MNIENEWKSGKLPIINGILYSDGKIDWINIEFGQNGRVIRNGSKIHLNDLVADNDLNFTEVAILDRKDDLINNAVIYCGDGGMGGDGFVLVESKTGSFEWLAFFENSNPFEKIEIFNDSICLYNNLNEKWIFNFHFPINLTVEKLSRS